MASGITHAISVDVEDWYQSTFDAHAELSDRFERSTMCVLEAFAAKHVRGTFFVLGLSAEKAAREAINLPLHPRASEKTVRRTVDFICKYEQAS